MDAYDFTSLSIGIVQVKEQFGLNPIQVGNLTASMAFGALFGALYGGYLVDKIGRFKTFLLDLVMFVVSTVLAALAPNYEWLMVWRFFMGIGVGLDFPVALSFVAEFTNTASRGRRVNVWIPLWCVAAIFGPLLGLLLYNLGAGPNLWRWIVGFGAVPAFVILVLRYVYMSESPLWAAQHGNLEEAARILEKTYGIKVVAEPDVALTSTIPTSYMKGIAKLFEKKYLSRTILTSVLCSMQSLEYFAVGFQLPIITQMIFGKGLFEAIIGGVVFNVFGLLGGLLQVYLTPKLGIRKQAMLGLVIVTVSLLVIGLVGHGLTIFATAAFVAGFIFGHMFGPAPQSMTMATLSYPTSIRGTATGWGQGMVRVGSICGFYFFPLMIAAKGLSTTLLILSIFPIIALLFLFFIKWEPTEHDVDLEDIAAGDDTSVKTPA